MARSSSTRTIQWGKLVVTGFTKSELAQTGFRHSELAGTGFLPSELATAMSPSQGRHRNRCLINCASPIACPARGGIKRPLLRSCCGSGCSLAYRSVRTVPYIIWCTTKCMSIIATKCTYAVPAGLKDAGLCINNPRGHTHRGPCLPAEDQIARGACGALPAIRCSVLLLLAFRNTVAGRIHPLVVNSISTLAALPFRCYSHPLHN